MFDRVAIFAATPGTTFLTLLLELLLSFRIGEAEIELDAAVIVGDAVEILDHALCNLTGFEPARPSVWGGGHDTDLAYRANPTSLLTPDGASRQILVEMAL
jgi:hypothetical protein